MNENIRCCLAGHINKGDINVKEKIKSIAEKLVTECNVKEFWVGNYSLFDFCAVSAVWELKSKYPHIKLEIIIPRIANADEYTDEAYIANCKYMVDNSGFLICCTGSTSDVAYKMYSYAKRKNKKIFNIAKITG